MNEQTASTGEKHLVSEAVILMAGSGSRLRGAEKTVLKPLVPVLDRPLISYIIDALVASGIETIHAVVGFEREMVKAAVSRLVPSNVQLHFIDNPEWQKQNGVSLLAAANDLTMPFLLTMSDHLLDHVIVDLLLEDADLNFLNVAIDRKLGSIFDLDDAMKVKTSGNQVVAIGKNLCDYDAIDTGLFICPLEIFAYLERANKEGDCSLADAVRLMAEDGKVRAIDIGNAWWQDIDTPSMLHRAEEAMRASQKLP